MFQQFIPSETDSEEESLFVSIQHNIIVKTNQKHYTRQRSGSWYIIKHGFAT